MTESARPWRPGSAAGPRSGPRPPRSPWPAWVTAGAWPWPCGAASVTDTRREPSWTETWTVTTPPARLIDCDACTLTHTRLRGDGDAAGLTLERRRPARPGRPPPGPTPRSRADRHAASAVPPQAHRTILLPSFTGIPARTAASASTSRTYQGRGEAKGRPGAGATTTSRAAGPPRPVGPRQTSTSSTSSGSGSTSANSGSAPPARVPAPPARAPAPRTPAPAPPARVPAPRTPAPAAPARAPAVQLRSSDASTPGIPNPLAVSPLATICPPDRRAQIAASAAVRAGSRTGRPAAGHRAR